MASPGSSGDHLEKTKEIRPNPLLLGEIRPGLWIGNLQSLRELPKIASSWTVISILKSDQLMKFARDVLAEIQAANMSTTTIAVRHLEWELPDHAQAEFLSPRLDEILQAMDGHSATSSPCLVHCAFGVSRSATVCAAWLLTRQHYEKLSEALNEIRKVRPGIEVNMGFVACLRALQECKGNVNAARQRLYPSR